MLLNVLGSSFAILRGRYMSIKEILLGHSPDPDDAFMFYALAKGKLDTGRFTIRHQLEDIQTLNERAVGGELDITAISFHAYPYVRDQYLLMPCGASVGEGYGPIVISTKPIDLDRLNNCTIAVPGKMTTAFLVLQMVLGKFNYSVVPFDQIIGQVVDGKVDAGLIIHEGQLTYQNQGLIKILDLGQWWYQQTNLPLPLGANVIKRSLGRDDIKFLVQLTRQSISYGLEHSDEALEYALQYARDMDIGLAEKFVKMYVNRLTEDLGPSGRHAVEELLGRAERMKLIPPALPLEFA